MTITVVVGNPKPNSRTLDAATRLAEDLIGRPADEVLDLVSLSAGLLSREDEAVKSAVRTVAASAVVVIASPTYKGSYTGLLKLFLDRFASRDGMQGVVAVPLMLGAGSTHSMAPDLLLRPVLAELGAICVLPGLFLLEGNYKRTTESEEYARRWAPVVDRLVATKGSAVAPAEAMGTIAPPFSAADLVDSRVLRDAFGCFPSGVAAVCSLVDGAPTGIAVSSFTSVSLDPPLVSVCVDNASTTWPRLRAAGRIGVSVLSEEHEMACRSLAAKTGDRFVGLTLHTTASGAVLIEGATAWLDCVIQEEVPAGDHHIALLRVVGLRAGPETRPLVFHRSGFQRLTETST